MPRKTKSKAKSKSKKGGGRIKSIVSGGSYDIRQGKLNRGGMPYMIPNPTPPIIVQLPPEKPQSEKQRETWRQQAERREMFKQIERAASNRQQEKLVVQTKEEISRKDTKQDVARAGRQRMQKVNVETTKKAVARKDVLSAISNPSKVSELNRQEQTEWVQTSKGRQARDALLKQIRERTPIEATSVADAPYEERLTRQTLIQEAQGRLETAYVDDAPIQELQVAPSVSQGFTMGQAGPRVSQRKLTGTDWVKSSDWTSPFPEKAAPDAIEFPSAPRFKAMDTGVDLGKRSRESTPRLVDQNKRSRIFFEA